MFKLKTRTESQKVCVLVPELVVRHWWENLLHNRRADLLKVMLLLRGNRRIIVINIPWYMDEHPAELPNPAPFIKPGGKG